MQIANNKYYVNDINDAMKLQVNIDLIKNQDKFQLIYIQSKVNDLISYVSANTTYAGVLDEKT